MTGITFRYGGGMASSPPAGEGRLVYRARLGLYVAPEQGHQLTDRLGRAILDGLGDVAPLDLLQVALAVDPRWWTIEGPPNLTDPAHPCYKDV